MKKILILATLILCLGFSHYCYAEETATTQNIYQSKYANEIENLIDKEQYQQAKVLSEKLYRENRSTMSNDDLGWYYYKIAFLEYKLGNNRNAIKYSKKSEKYVSANYRPYLLRAGLYFDMKKYSNALKEIDKAIKLNPEIPFLYVLKAKICATWNPRTALEFYDKAIALNPKDYSIYESRGIFKYYTHDNEGALKDFDKAIKLAPKNASPYTYRGATKANLKDFKGAIKDYNKVIELKSDDWVLYQNRGLAKIHLGYKKEAIEDFTKSIKLNQENGDAYYYRGAAVFDISNKESFKSVKTDMLKSISFRTKKMEHAYDILAHIYSEENDTKEALKYIDKAINITPSPTVMKYYEYRATLRKEIGDIKGSQKDLAKIKEIENNINGYALLKSYYDKGEFKNLMKNLNGKNLSAGWFYLYDNHKLVYGVRLNNKLSGDIYEIKETPTENITIITTYKKGLPTKTKTYSNSKK